MGYGYYNAHALVERLLVAETSRVPGIVEDLGPFRQWANRALRAAADSSSRSSRERLHAQLALLPAGLVNPESLIDPLLIAPPEEFRAILGMLSPHRQELAGLLWTVVKSADLDRERRLRAACALATFDPDQPAWRQIAPDVASLLLAENPLLVNEWVDMLRPVGRSLVGPLADVSAGLSDRGARRLATSILADYANADPEQLVDLIVNADPEQFAVFLPRVWRPTARSPSLCSGTASPVRTRISPRVAALTPRKRRPTCSPAIGRPRRWRCCGWGCPTPSGPYLSSRLTRVCKPRRFKRWSTSGRPRTCSRSGS